MRLLSSNAPNWTRSQHFRRNGIPPVPKAYTSATVGRSGTSSVSLSSCSLLMSMALILCSLRNLRRFDVEVYLSVQPRLFPPSWPNSSPRTSVAAEKTWQQFEKNTLATPLHSLYSLSLSISSRGTNKTTLN